MDRIEAYIRHQLSKKHCDAKYLAYRLAKKYNLEEQLLQPVVEYIMECPEYAHELANKTD